MQYALLALLVIPVACTILFMLIPSQYPQLVRYVALAGAVSMFVLSLVIFIVYQYDGGDGLRYRLQWTWLENVGFLKGNGITFFLALDGIAAPLVLLNGIVILAATLVSWNINYRPKDFFVLLFLLVAGVYGTFISEDLFFFFFWYEVAVLPMYLLIAVWGASSNFGTFTRT
ncbi:MAG: hypothetical protein ABI559_06655, partial [Chloroflexota bacterium]